MFVSLLNDVRSLGPKGAIVDVPTGYAQNFLFPEHLAVLASKETLAADKALDERPVESSAERADRELAGELDGLEVVVPVAVKKGKLVSDVTRAEIRQALKALDYKVPFDVIKLTHPITELGTFEVPVVFSTGFEAKLSVIVEEATKTDAVE